MQDFVYNIPTKVYFGEGQVKKQLGRLAGEFGDVALLVYGGGSIKKNGIYVRVTESLKAAGITYYELEDVEPNPRVTSVAKGVELCRKYNVKVLIPVGGGSCIDCAKAIGMSVGYDGDPWDLIVDSSLIHGCMPIIAIPTVAATGSEMDNDAMIINLDTKDKKGLGCPEAYPRYTIMDPTFTYSVSKKQTAAGVADIMSHIFEIYFQDGPVASYMTDRVMEALLKTCVQYGKIACEEPTNYEARANLMWASVWAINGFANCGPTTYRWACHPIEHPLGAYYDETHGIGLAIITPHWMRKTLNDKTVNIFKSYGIHVWGIDPALEVYEIAKLSIEKTAEFFTSLGIPTTLRECGIGIASDEYFAEMTEKALGPAGRINSYIPLSREDVMEIYAAAL